MAIYRFTMKKTMRSISTWILIILPLVAILGLLLISISSAYQRDWANPNPVLTLDERSDRIISYFRWNWIWLMRILVFFFLFAFAAIKSAHIFRDEIDEGTLLIIVSKPISRWNIFWEKWLALQTNVFLLLTISLWVPVITCSILGIPSGAIKWLFTNIALTWAFSLFIQLIITSLAVMLSLVMGSKGSISLFSLIGVLGFVLWLPSFFLVGVGSLLSGNSIGSKNMDGGLSEYLAFKNDQKNYPLLFDKTYKNFQDNDGNGLYNTFQEYYKNIFNDDYHPYGGLLKVEKRDEISLKNDINLNTYQKITLNSYPKQFLLKDEWLRDYEETDIFRTLSDFKERTNLEQKKAKIRENKDVQKIILNNLDFNKLANRYPFKNILQGTKKITFSIDFKINNDNKIKSFKNNTLFFWQNENEKDILKTDSYDFKKAYHLNYNIENFADFLTRYNSLIETKIQDSNNEILDIKLEDRDKKNLESSGYTDYKNNLQADSLYFTFDYESILKNDTLKKQLYKKLISLIPTQSLESNSNRNLQDKIKNDLLFYKPKSDSFNPILNAFNNSAKLAEQYYRNVKILLENPQIRSQFDGKEIDEIIDLIFANPSDYDFPNILSKLKSTAKTASNIKKNNIISIFNIFEHFEKMFKAIVEPNVSWGPIGLSAPYEISLKFYTGEDGIIYGTLWENSTYRADQIVLFTVYSLITIFSTLSAFALLKFKNLT